MFNNINPYECDPPGTFHEVVSHPAGEDRSIEKAVIMEHRFAFFFWMKWRNAFREDGWLRQDPPTLVTIDWHRDLAPPPDDLRTKLEQLNQSNLSNVANFVWAQFDQTNDGHILCAAWLDLVGDIILLKNSAREMQDTFVDKTGSKHSIYEFEDYDRFEDFLLKRDDQNIFFDIDLDYFIHGKSSPAGYHSENFRPYSDEEIKRVINYKNPGFQHILPKIDGLTMALEPSYCGGISNSCKILQIVNDQLFDEKNNWRHLTPSK
jgi:hypothetical protein